jgi:hypothetical protein
MAHRVAELMVGATRVRSKTQRSHLEQECADLILSLWRLERGSSRDNPVHTLNQTLGHIADMRPPAWRRFQVVIAGVPPAEDKVKRPLSSGDIASRLIHLGEEEQELLFALLCADLPTAFPEDASAAEEVYGQSLDREKYDALMAKRQRVHDAPLARETPAILDTRNKTRRGQEFVRAMQRLSRERDRLTKALVALDTTVRRDRRPAVALGQ